MNSEELEQSLRTEFEQHLKQVFADVRQEISALQSQVEEEFERHRSQLTDAFEAFSVRAQTQKELDAGFRESIVEHLRLSRDEGARITATAIAEAEAMEKEAAEEAAAAVVPVVPSAGVSQLRDGINDICGQNSQASILKSLVTHAGQFTPRGAFFIVKNEHLVGWRVFGRDEEENAKADAAVREIFFPVSDKTTLGESLKSLSAVESLHGERAGDAVFLDKLEFGEPEKMVAIPLVARGRGVAVLYADKGANGDEINVEALETLVRVAGLTVEVLAAAASSGAAAMPAPSVKQPVTSNYSAPVSSPIEAPATSGATEYQSAEAQSSASESNYGAYAEPIETHTADESETGDNDYSDEEIYRQPEAAQPVATADDYAVTDYSATDYSVEESGVTDFESTTAEPEQFQPVYQAEQTETESYSWNQPSSSEDSYAHAEPESDTVETADYSENASNGGQYQFDDAQSSYASPQNQLETASSPIESFQSFEAAEYVQPAFEPAQNSFPAAGEENYGSFEPQSADAAPAPVVDGNFDYKPAVEQTVEPEKPKPARSRFSDRNIDLPVEVSEDERRLHNDARRFARLLVSEIKLYNEQKVKEGRDGNDLYERLREAIDRSREMYDKRVQPPVAAKFDYFHYELVNSLAEGDEAKLGESYVGSVV